MSILNLSPKDRRYLAIGKAVERACEELPEGFDLHIELERGAGTIRLYFAENDASQDEWLGDDFADQIHNAINTAIAESEK